MLHEQMLSLERAPLAAPAAPNHATPPLPRTTSTSPLGSSNAAGSVAGGPRVMLRGVGGAWEPYPHHAGALGMEEHEQVSPHKHALEARGNGHGGARGVASGRKEQGVRAAGGDGRQQHHMHQQYYTQQHQQTKTSESYQPRTLQWGPSPPTTAEAPVPYGGAASPQRVAVPGTLQALVQSVADVVHACHDAVGGVGGFRVGQS